MSWRRELRESERTSTPAARVVMTRVVWSWRVESKDWRSGSDRQASWYEVRSGFRSGFDIDCDNGGLLSFEVVLRKQPIRFRGFL